MRCYSNPAFRLGAFTNPDAAVRREAIDLTKRGIDAARAMGASLMTLWLGQDGFDYSFQADYARLWDDEVAAIREVARHDPACLISIEYKPNEPRSFSLLPDLATTLLALAEVGTDNLGVTLDFAVAPATGDDPAQSLARAQRRGRPPRPRSWLMSPLAAIPQLAACLVADVAEDRAMTDRSCPNCGTGLGDALDRFRMTTCPSCGTSVILEDERVTRAGESGVLHDAPLLFGLGETVVIGGAGWRTVGQARFSYGRGSWDEFWATEGAGRGAWISVDEGDVVLQAALDPADWPALGPDAGLGTRVTCRRRTYRVTEVETATCEALRGSFPEVLRVGESHRFLNLAGDEGDLLSGEFWEGGQAWFLGRWLDPFELRPGADIGTGAGTDRRRAS